ncbi:MAG: phosphotyrosine protein phosphatase [Lentilitoribacter sp.]
MTVDQIRVLFVCSRNQWRSPTGETLWRRKGGVQVRSAGTSSAAKRRISAFDIEWADIIFFMETKHKKRVQQNFRDLLNSVEVHVLDIPDDYGFMDPELVSIIEAKTEDILV